MRSSVKLLLFVAAACAAAACKPGGPPAAGQPDEERLAALKDHSLKILPESYANIWIGMPEEAFAKARSGAKPNLAKSDPDERRWYREVDATGVNVWYGFDRPTGRLVVIQFANQLPTWRLFSEHAALLVEKYGTDNELYICPTGDPRFKMTRLLWPKQPVSIMEAILEAESSVSVTMVISSLKDARRAVERQKCQKVDKEAALEQWVQEQVDKEKESAPPPPQPPPGQPPLPGQPPPGDSVQ